MGRWPKGVSNRNAALKWIYQFVQETGDDSGALYFADDDNTYDIRLFEEVSYLQSRSYLWDWVCVSHHGVDRKQSKIACDPLRGLIL